MSPIYLEHRPIQSLVERKKQQWAQEREELAGLSENIPWGFWDSLRLYDQPFIKSDYDNKYSKKSEFLRRDSTASSTASVGAPRRRKSLPAQRQIQYQTHQSLPALHKNQNATDTTDEKSDKEMGGETSGYGSDNAHHSPNRFPAYRKSDESENWPPTASEVAQRDQGILRVSAHQVTGYESSSSGRDDRLKWGEKRHPLGRVWASNAKGPIGNGTDPTPGWVKRGLERNNELLVVNNSSPAETPEQDFVERPSTSSSSMTNKCFIRGQNAPVDAGELAEREHRRQVALAHQEDIRQQLIEREKRRDQERLKRMQEERAEEQRIAREQEVQRQRQAEQEKMRLMKEQRDRQRKEALREAIEIAEKEAKEEKVKLRLLKRNQLNLAEMSKSCDKDKDKTEKNFCNELKQQFDEKSKCKAIDIPPTDSAKVNENILEEKTDQLKDPNQSSIVSDQALVVVGDKTEKNSTSSDSEVSYAYPIPLQNYNSLHTLPALNHESIGLLVHQPVAEKCKNYQIVLVPALGPTIPMQFSGSQAVQTQNMPLVTRSSTPKNQCRILTPTQYRNRKLTCDRSTQTDNSEALHIAERLSNLDVCNELRSRKDRRSRSEMRPDALDAQDRPKWGVNRPPTRYLKQSEKDPLYQRRKLRQKQRQTKSFDDKRYSSDESQSGSPRTYRQKRGVWRKDDALFTNNVKVYQSELIPLDSDKEHIYHRAKPHPKCCCRCTANNSSRSRADVFRVESPRDYRNKLPAYNNNQMNEGTIHNDFLAEDNWEERDQILYSPSMDDFLTKKRNSEPILDLSRLEVNTKEEFRQMIDRIPDFKMKAEKVRPEDAKVKDVAKKLKFKTGKRDFKALKQKYAFKDPTPDEMKVLKLEDLAKVNIDWKMLTNIRPKLQLDELFFSRIVALKKNELKTQAFDKRALVRDSQIKRVKSKFGGIEYRPINCQECQEDFCTGRACIQLAYDCFTRIEVNPGESEMKVISIDLGIKKKKRRKRKTRDKSKSIRRRKTFKSPKKSSKCKTPRCNP